MGRTRHGWPWLVFGIHGEIPDYHSKPPKLRAWLKSQTSAKRTLAAADASATTANNDNEKREEESGCAKSEEDSSHEDQESSTLAHIPNDVYVVCRVYGKINKKCVARVTEKALQGYDVQFLKRHITSNRFTVSNEKSAFIEKDEVVVKSNHRY
ncbi:hypothetical protein JTB14_024892 [Gonioctena quinquepunctata]|nr:hypothetical protein JTB14_024892 [Gonioctena quinquepunctata]